MEDRAEAAVAADLAVASVEAALAEVTEADPEASGLEDRTITDPDITFTAAGAVLIATADSDTAEVALEDCLA